MIHFDEQGTAGHVSHDGPDVQVRAARTICVFSAVAKANQANSRSWKETVDVVSVSHSGAGFYMTRECKPGQLVSLMMPMPRNFRRYDHEKKLYKVWGLVQHCSAITHNGNDVFHAGVAFVGKAAPASYYESPGISYRVCGVAEDGFWKIETIESVFRVRNEPRYWKAIGVTLFELDQLDAALRQEMAYTENISASGASVISFLNVDVGDRVRVYCQPHDFSAYALVRNRNVTHDRPRLHLEFIEHLFPIKEVAPQVDR